MRRGMLPLFVLIGAFAASAIAAEYHTVKQDGTGDFISIQAAIDVAEEGDTITVYPGTYYENIHFDGKNIVLRSTDPEDWDVVEATVIDGSRIDSVVAFSGAENESCALTGFSITNGRNGLGGGIRGGAKGDPFAKPTISKCRIHNNSASGSEEYPAGGGIYGCCGPILDCEIASNSSYMGGGLNSCGGTIRRCAISCNSAQCGGGVRECDGHISHCEITKNSADGWGAGLYECDGTIEYCVVADNLGSGLRDCGGSIIRCQVLRNEGSGLDHCNGHISHCLVQGNSASYGGGMRGCDALIEYCTIIENSAGYGGGMSGCKGEIRYCMIERNEAYFEGGGLRYCRAEISGCTISENKVSLKGGGIHGLGSSISIRDSIISRNTAELGGGIDECGGTIRNCLICGNSALELGGGLRMCSADISNCTIVNNTASIGGGVYWCHGQIQNCILWGNRADTGPNHHYSASPDFCCIQDWTGGGTNNITKPPQFAAGPLGGYYLSCMGAGQGADSPCIDAGEDTSASLGLDRLTTRTDDFPDTGMVDIGYHYSGWPLVEAWLNQTEFVYGDSLSAFAKLNNPGHEFTVDLYAAFMMPGGEIASLTNEGFAPGHYPWFADLILPSGFHSGPEEVLQFSVPTGCQTGDYLFASAIAFPGETAFVSISSVSFAISD